MDVRDILIMKTSGLSDLSVDEMEFALEEVRVAICNYCMITSIPTELNFVWANMASDMLRATHAQTNSGEKTGDVVTSLSVGDVSVSYDTTKTAHTVSLDDIVLNYRSQLNNFRRVIW